MESFDYLNALVAGRFPRPGWKYLEQIDGTTKKVKEAQKVMFSVADRVIAEKRAKMAKGEGVPDEEGSSSGKGNADMLGEFQSELPDPRAYADSVIYSASEDYFMRTKNFDGSAPDDEELRDVVMNLCWYSFRLYVSGDQTQHPSTSSDCRP